MNYGLGWVIQDYRGRRLVSHAGIIDGFRCHLTMVPDAKVGIVVLTNLHRTRMNQALSNAIVDSMLGLPPKDWNAIVESAVRRETADIAKQLQNREAERQPGTRPSLPLAAFIGSYEHPAFGTVRISLDGSRLMWAFNSFRAPLEHFQDDSFSLLLNVFGRPLVRFKAGSDGVIESLHVGGKMDVEFHRSPRAPK